MKISEFVDYLNEQKEKWGDLEVQHRLYKEDSNLGLQHISFVEEDFRVDIIPDGRVVLSVGSY
jgi:hypothetical protein